MLFFYCDDNSVIGFAIFILNELLLYTQGVVQRSVCVMLDGASSGLPGGHGVQPEASSLPTQHSRDHTNHAQPGHCNI